MNLLPSHIALPRAASLPALAAAWLLAAALGGCTAEAEGPAPEPRGTNAITFGAATSAMTRTAPGSLTLDGSGTGEQSLQEAGFGVFASYTGLHPYVSSAITPDFMWNQLVAYNTSASAWDYTPVRYWPDPIEGFSPYVTFFAYAPYAPNPGSGSTAADRCIVDLSRPTEKGDPWLVYQLGGSEDDWQAHQVDLLYDFLRDQQQVYVHDRICFQFRHALASAGDDITVRCGPELQSQLLSAYAGTTVSLTLRRLTLAYTLLRKGRLRLNSTSTPRWESVQSDVPTVVRRLTLEPAGGHTLATVDAVSEIGLTDYRATNQGIFYIPLTSAPGTQKVDITLEYSITTGSGTTDHTLTTTIDLDAVATAGAGRSFRITMPKIAGL